MTGWRRFQVPLAALLVVAASAALAVPFLREWQQALRAEAGALAAVVPLAARRQDSLGGLLDSARRQLALERARAASRADSTLHLVVAVDSGTLALMRDGVALRTMPAQFAGARPDAGVRTIARLVVTEARPAGPVLDSLGRPIAVRDSTQVTVQRVSFDDGTELRAGAASDVLVQRGGTGARGIVVSRADFDALRPNLTKGMRAHIF